MLLVSSSCSCLMRPPSQDTKPYQTHYLNVCCVLRAHVQFCRFDKADVARPPYQTGKTVHVHAKHNTHYRRRSVTLQPPTATLITLFPAQSTDILVYWIGKSFVHVPPVGVEPSTSCVNGEHPIH